PDLARAMAAALPEEEEELTPAELQADRAALLAKIHALPKPPLPFVERRPPSRVLFVAAAVIVLVAIGGIMIWVSTRGETRPKATRILYADGQDRKSTRLNSSH